MAEVFGIVSGAIGIAAAFSACVEVFDYVQLGRRFGKDYQTSQLQLTLLRLRLSRWGAAVDIYNTPHFGCSSATEHDIETAKDTLLQILVLFEDNKTIADRYKLKIGKNQTVESQDSMIDLTTDMAITSVNNKMNALAVKRRKGASILKLASWSMHHDKIVSRLVEDISGLVESLEQLFPPPPTAQSHLVAREVSEMQGEQEIEALTATAQGIDQVLFAAANQAAGHQFKNIAIEAGEDGSVLNGNTFSGDYNRTTQFSQSNSYNGITIKGTKGLRVQNGDQHGGSGFFNRN